MSKRRAGLVMMIIGILAVAAGLGLGIYNLWDNYRAGVRADIVLDAIAGLPLDFDKGTFEVDGHQYIGTVTIPSIDVELPVQAEWSLALLKNSPCRYIGSRRSGAGHGAL